MHLSDREISCIKSAVNLIVKRKRKIDVLGNKMCGLDSAIVTVHNMKREYNNDMSVEDNEKLTDYDRYQITGAIAIPLGRLFFSSNNYRGKETVEKLATFIEDNSVLVSW